MRTPNRLLVSLALAFAACDSSEDRCTGVVCGAHGSCEDGACVCESGYRGSQCQICAPDCEGKTCGDDGCGGTCGSGPCECTPSCAGKSCGDDGCGGLCGSCGPGMECTNGSCCTPDCSGKTCGFDGCSDVCGKCADDQACINGACSVDQGLGCILRPDSCSSDADCGGTPNKCIAAPILTCGFPPDDCGSTDTVCKNMMMCWRGCAQDMDCPSERPRCVSGVCQACLDDNDCENGLPCVNDNPRVRCGSAGDCVGVAAQLCQ